MTVLHQYIAEVPMEVVSRAQQIMSSLLNVQESVADDVVYKMTGTERWCIEMPEEEGLPLDMYAIVRFWCEKQEGDKIKFRLNRMKRKYISHLAA